MRATRLAPTALLALLWLGCPEKSSTPAAPDAAVVPNGPKVVTLLVTGSENGYLLPTPDDSGVSRGGAAQIMGRWVKYGHCPGKLLPRGAPACPEDPTLVLSTGDNLNGASISSFFDGTPAADAMAVMGYAASAFGNRELDFGREGFEYNRKLSGIQYLAANLSEVADGGSPLKLPAGLEYTRLGVKIGVLGLTASKTLRTVMAGRAEGLTLTDAEAALTRGAAALWAQGISALVVVSDDCLKEVKPLIEKHPEWRLSVVAGRQCEAEVGTRVGNTYLVYPGRHFNTYDAVKLTFDPSKPAAEQLTQVSSETVEVVNDEKAPPPEKVTAKVVAGWKARRDAVLGEVIGFSKTGLEQTSDAMTKWLAESLRESSSADLGLVNRKGVRQSLPEGKITRASVYDVIPFENSVVVATLTGEDLLPVLNNPEARVSGMTLKGKSWVDAKGAKLDPKRKYTVATTDYLYFGGDGFEIEKKDQAPNFTSEFWQTRVIDSTIRLHSTEQAPLETLIK